MTDNLAGKRPSKTLIQGITSSSKNPHHLLQTSVFNKGNLQSALKSFQSAHVIESSHAAMADLEDQASQLLHLQCKVLMLWDRPEVRDAEDAESWHFSSSHDSIVCCNC